MARRQHILALPIAALALALLLPFSQAFAFPIFCEGAGSLYFSPFHPMAGDLVNFSGGWDRNIDKPIVLAKVRQLDDGQSEIDVVFTEDRTRLPDYTVVAIGPDGDVDGVLGSFPVGDYPVTLKVFVDNAETGTLDPSCFPTTEALHVYATSGLAPVVEYYHGGLDQYFLTQDSAEIGLLDAGRFPGWTRTGESFLAYEPGQTNGRLFAMARFYLLTGSGGHMYTMANFFEADEILWGFDGDWTMETPDAFELDNGELGTGNGSPRACRDSEVPLYRLWDPHSTSHRYTVNPTTRDAMIARGYVLETDNNDLSWMCAVKP